MNNILSSVKSDQNSTQQFTKCKICCTTDMFYSPRYPNQVCENCIVNSVDSEGNIVKFYNVDFYGGFESYHYVIGSDGQTNVVQKNEHVCWINGKKCFADEAKFGGIIVQCDE
jgi:hypothetical protein